MGRLPPRHPCHFEVKRGGSTLSRLGAASAHPQGLALMESGLPAIANVLLRVFRKSILSYLAGESFFQKLLSLAQTGCTLRLS